MNRNTTGLVLAVSTFAMCSGLCAAGDSFIGNLKTIKARASTVPGNGDVNPYGVAVVRETTGRLRANHVLVSNFNNSANAQGTGTTIVQVSPGDRHSSLFAQIQDTACPGGIGLTTALVVLRSGWVIVGSLPTMNGTKFTGPGCLIVLDSSGKVAGAITDPSINGPWDMTALDKGSAAALFVTNVLNGTVAANGGVVTEGTVLRIDLDVSSSEMPHVKKITQIGSGFAERTDPAALVIGPTGVGLAANGTLYVADSVNSGIRAIDGAVSATSDAGIGRLVSGRGALNGPLGLAVAPNGDIITVNSGDGNMTETTPAGAQVAVKSVDVTGAGAGTLFGLAIRPHGSAAIYFVNDGNNTLDLLH